MSEKKRLIESENNRQHEHSHEHGEACSCGHEHSHSHGSCGCAMCQLEDLHTHEDGCGCGHDHGETPERTIPLPVLGAAAAAAVVVGKLPLPWIVQAGVYLLVLVLWGKDLFLSGLKGLRRLSLDENTLMTIAVFAAFLLGDYFEALMVTVLFSLGEILESKAVQRSRRDIAQVVNIRPQTANLVQPDKSTKEIPSRELRVGDTILVKVGERVPVDGLVLAGESTMDRSALTGESVAVGVQTGDSVMAGEVNLSGVLTCRCETTFENSTASRIIQMVEESAAQKGKTEKLITRFARYYTPVVVTLALLTAVVPPLVGLGSFSMWINRALVFLVASCPCALVISVPLAFYSGVGAISKQGVLVKGTKFLEPLAKVNTLVFDKTGTLTTGELTVSKVEAFEPDDTAHMFALTALAESFSSHPIAQAICSSKQFQPKAGEWEAYDPSEASQVQEIAGKGVSLQWRGQRVLCGSRRLMEENQISMNNVVHANVYTAVGQKLIGSVSLSDLPREDAAETLRKLKTLGVQKTVMLTGDSALSAQVVQKQVGVDECHSDLMPQDKAQHLKQIKQAGGITAFVGDGINDAPVIAAADIGIAMGLGTDAAIESADAVLMSNRLSSLPNAIHLARRTVSIVKANIIFIFAVKALVLILGVLGIAPIWLAVFADVGVSVITVLNGVRILGQK